jgi:hypothetical protein
MGEITAAVKSRTPHATGGRWTDSRIRSDAGGVDVAELHVATKVPPGNGQFPPASGVVPMDAFPGSWIRENLETSL